MLKLRRLFLVSGLALLSCLSNELSLKTKSNKQPANNHQQAQTQGPNTTCVTSVRCQSQNYIFYPIKPNTWHLLYPLQRLGAVFSVRWPLPNTRTQRATAETAPLTRKTHRQNAQAKRTGRTHRQNAQAKRTGKTHSKPRTGAGGSTPANYPRRFAALGAGGRQPGQGCCRRRRTPRWWCCRSRRRSWSAAPKSNNAPAHGRGIRKSGRFSFRCAKARCPTSGRRGPKPKGVGENSGLPRRGWPLS